MTRAESAPTIRVDGLTKRFGSVTALDGVSFEVRGGRVTGFLGHNGSGKTTTMRALLGLTSPDSGTSIFTDRQGMEVQSPLVAWASEKCGLQGSRSGRAHLRAAAASIGQDKAAVDAALAEAGLSGVARKRISSYSTGMRRRLTLAEVSITPSDWVLLDEPLNGLDPEGVQWMRHRLRTMAEEGRAVLVSSHLLNEAERYVDDVVMLGRGKVLFMGSLADWRDTFGNQADVWVADAAKSEQLLEDLDIWVADSDRIFLPEEQVSEALKRLQAAGLGARVNGPGRLSLEAMYNNAMKG